MLSNIPLDEFPTAYFSIPSLLAMVNNAASTWVSVFLSFGIYLGSELLVYLVFQTTKSVPTGTGPLPHPGLHRERFQLSTLSWIFR